MSQRIQVIEGDITKLVVDAIVNPANTSLLGGGGVDGAIHRAAGPELYLECQKLKGCATGEAKITKGYKLPAKFVIHTVGPIWREGKRGEAEKLASCYRNSLILAEENGVKTIAFPAISTGAYGFPLDEATRVAVTEVSQFLIMSNAIETVTFACFGKEAYDIYVKTVGELAGPMA
jgi:O-acetyl-ADP-ribose deacetylase (regulator of RNase III)